MVLPASPGFYAAGAGATARQLVDFVAAKVLDALGVPHTLFTRWAGDLGRGRVAGEDPPAMPDEPRAAPE